MQKHRLLEQALPSLFPFSLPPPPPPFAPATQARKYLCVCRLVVCMTELLIYRPVQFYSGKNFEFTCKSLDHSPSENSKKHFQLTQSKFATETS